MKLYLIQFLISKEEWDKFKEQMDKQFNSKNQNINKLFITSGDKSETESVIAEKELMAEFAQAVSHEINSRLIHLS